MHRTNELFVERLPLVPERPWVGYPVSIAFVLIGFAARLAVDGVLPPGLPYVTFFPAVILSSFLFGVGPGIAAALLGGGLAYFWFILPVEGGHHGAGALIAICFYALVVGVDIALVHWMQRANYKLAVERERSRQLAETREMLFRELQHRVSNNLQVIGALLTLHRRTIEDERAVRALDEAARRLSLVGRISRSLYDSHSARHRLEPFLRALVADILQASGREDVTVNLDIGCDPDLPSAASVPMALVIAESVSNAIEHGFAARADAVIDIRVRHHGEAGMSIEIADNGQGLPPGFSLERSDSLGLRIASALAAQLKGAFDLSPRPGGGAVARLVLPL